MLVLRFFQYFTRISWVRNDHTDCGLFIKPEPITPPFTWNELDTGPFAEGDTGTNQQLSTEWRVPTTAAAKRMIMAQFVLDPESVQGRGGPQWLWSLCCSPAPHQEQGLFSLPLNLSWPCDEFWPIPHNVQLLKLVLKRLSAFALALGTPPPRIQLSGWQKPKSMDRPQEGKLRCSGDKQLKLPRIRVGPLALPA